jgi:hypothetical protein
MPKPISLAGRTLFLAVIRRRLRSSGFTASWKKNIFPTSWNEGLDFRRVNTFLTAQLPIENLWSTVQIPLTETKTFSRFVGWRDVFHQNPGRASTRGLRPSKHDRRFARLWESLNEEELRDVGCLVIPLATPLQFLILDGRHRACVSYFSPLNEEKLINVYILVRRQDLKKFRRWSRYRASRFS